MTAPTRADAPDPRPRRDESGVPWCAMTCPAFGDPCDADCRATPRGLTDVCRPMLLADYARHAALVADPKHVLVLLSAETVAALREWHRNTGPTFTSIPQGLAVAVAESMEADLAAVLETPLLARGPTEARCSCGHPAAYHGAHGCSGEAGWGCGPCLCKEGSTPPPAPAGRDEKE